MLGIFLVAERDGARTPTAEVAGRLGGGAAEASLLGVGRFALYGFLE